MKYVVKSIRPEPGPGDLYTVTLVPEKPATEGHPNAGIWPPLLPAEPHGAPAGRLSLDKITRAAAEQFSVGQAFELPLLP